MKEKDKRTNFEKMAFYRILLSYLYPKTRKKSSLTLVVILLFVAIMFSLQRNNHRKEKNEALESENAFEVYKDMKNIIIKSKVDNHQVSNNEDEHFLKDQVVYDPENLEKVRYESYNSSKFDIALSALIFLDSERSIVKDKLKFIFKSLKVNFDFITWNRFDDNYLTIPRLIGKYGQTRYQLILFTNEAIFDNLDNFSRSILTNHCKIFDIGVIILTHPVHTQNMRRSMKLTSLPLTIFYGIDQMENIEITESQVLNIAKSNNVLKGPLPGEHRVLFQSNHPTFEPIAVTNIANYFPENSEEKIIGKGTIILCDKGEVDGIRKVLFGVMFWESWLYQLILMDALMYVSKTSLGYDGMKRYIQIDIDDVFVGKTGKRLIKEDVMVSKMLCYHRSCLCKLVE